MLLLIQCRSKHISLISVSIYSMITFVISFSKHLSLRSIRSHRIDYTDHALLDEGKVWARESFSRPARPVLWDNSSEHTSRRSAWVRVLQGRSPHRGRRPTRRRRRPSPRLHWWFSPRRPACPRSPARRPSRPTSARFSSPRALRRTERRSLGCVCCWWWPPRPP